MRCKWLILQLIGPKDYRAVSETRIFPAGSIEGQSICVTITTVYDNTVEYTEAFQVTLTASDPNVTIGDRAGGTYLTVFMTDNDGEIIYTVYVSCEVSGRGRGTFFSMCNERANVFPLNLAYYVLGV